LGALGVVGEHEDKYEDEHEDEQEDEHEDEQEVGRAFQARRRWERAESGRFPSAGVRPSGAWRGG